MKKTLKRVLCLTLAFLMLFSVMSVGVSADDDEYLYIYLGNSTSQGYKLYDHTDTQYRADGDTQATSAYSTIRVFADYLADKVDDLHMRDFTLTGMRSAELRALLDPSYYHSDKIDHLVKRHLDPGGYYVRALPDIDPLTGRPAYNANEKDGYGSYENLSKDITNAVTNADLIVYDLCTTDFGTYFSERFLDVIDGDAEALAKYEKDTLANILANDGDPTLAAAAEALRVSLSTILEVAELPADMVTGLLEALLYSYACFYVNFDKAMEQIYIHNPDANVIVVGPDNIMAGLTAEFNGLELSMEDLWGVICEAITAHIVTARYSSVYKFADLSKGIDMVINDIAKGALTDTENSYDGVPYAKMYEKIFAEYSKGSNLGLSSLIGGAALMYGGDAAAAKSAVMGNIAKAAAIDTVPLGDIISGFSNSKAMAVRAMLNYDNSFNEAQINALIATANALGRPARDFVPYLEMLKTETTDADRAMLMVALRFQSANGLGGHPSPLGYAQKAEAIEKVYESDYSADGTYLARAVDSAMSFVKALFLSILGDKEAAAALKQMILDFFAPMMKVFNLLGSFGNK